MGEDDLTPSVPGGIIESTEHLTELDLQVHVLLEMVGPSGDGLVSVPDAVGIRARVVRSQVVNLKRVLSHTQLRRTLATYVRRHDVDRESPGCSIGIHSSEHTASNLTGTVGRRGADVELLLAYAVQKTSLVRVNRPEVLNNT